MDPKQTCGQTGRFVLLYGSQTGNAQGIAEDISQKAVARGYDCVLLEMNQYKQVEYLHQEGYFLAKRS